MKALTVGGAMIDTIAIVDRDEIDRLEARGTAAAFLLLPEGRKTEAIEISTHCGGGAVNSAVAMARLDVDVGALVRIGTDTRAHLLLARLKAEGVSTDWVVRDPLAATGASVHIASHERDAAIFTFRGANTRLSARDLEDKAFVRDLIYITGLAGHSMAHFSAIVAKGRANDALIAANPSTRQLTDESGSFEKALGGVDILNLNRNEAGTLLPALVPLSQRYPASGPDVLSDVAPLIGGGAEMPLAAFFRAVGSLGPRYVVLTCGSEGAFVGTPGRIFFCPALASDVRGTAGAGDAFGATFSASVAQGLDVETAMRAAAINAASVTHYVDTQSGLLRKNALNARLQETRHNLAVRSWPLQTASAA